MTELFQFPETAPTPATPSYSKPLPVAHVLSERVVVQSARTGKNIEYARLSDADHKEVRNMIRALWDYRADIRMVLDQPSGLYGSRGGGKAQTFSDVLEGFYDKMHQRHPILRGRVGEDLTIKQLGELNRLIDALDAQYGGGLVHVPVP